MRIGIEAGEVLAQDGGGDSALVGVGGVAEDSAETVELCVGE